LCGILGNFAIISGSIWTNPGDPTFDGTDGSDTNTYIDDVHGPNLSSTAVAFDRELLQNNSLSTCDEVGGGDGPNTFPCFGACSGQSTHDTVVTSMAVGRPPAGGFDVGVAKAGQFLTVSHDTDVHRTELHAYALEMGIEVVARPTCSLGVVNLTCSDSCAVHYPTFEAEAGGSPGPFYVIGPTDDAAANDFPCPACIDSQPAFMPVTPTFVPADNWCGLADYNQPLPIYADFALVSHSVGGAGTATSWMHGVAAGVFMVMCERYACSDPPTLAQRAAIMQRLCRTARKVGPTAYTAAWDKGTRLYPGAAWNTNIWNNQHGCGVIDLGYAITAKLSGLDY
jgi:hypothetical protein